MDIGQLFCDIDDFFIEYEQQMASKPLPDTETSKKRPRPSKLHKSEVMTGLVAFHQSGQAPSDSIILNTYAKNFGGLFRI